MTALIITGAAILLLALLLNIKLRAEIKFYGGELEFKVKYLWITLFPLKVRKKKEKRVKKHKERSEESAAASGSEKKEAAKDAAEADLGETAEDNAPLKGDTGGKKEKKKEKLSDRIERIGDSVEKAKIVWSFSKKWLVHIFKRIYLKDLVIDFTVAGEDAYKAAMSYGSVSAVTYGAISAVSALFPTKIKTVDIVCDFEGKRSVFDGEVKVSAAPSAILAAVFGILFGLLKNFGKLKGEKTRTEKEAA